MTESVVVTTVFIDNKSLSTNMAVGPPTITANLIKQGCNYIHNTLTNKTKLKGNAWEINDSYMV